VLDEAKGALVIRDDGTWLMKQQLVVLIRDDES